MGRGSKLKRNILAVTVAIPIVVFGVLSALNISEIGDWTLDEVFKTNGWNAYADSTVDSGGKVHIAYIGSSSGFYGLHHAVQSGDRWAVTKVVAMDIYAMDPSIVIDSSDHAYITWTKHVDVFTDEPGAIGFATDRSGAWDVDMLEWETDPSCAVMALDEGGNPHIIVSDTWYERIADSTDSYRRSSVSHLTLDGDTWDTEVIMILDDTVSSSHVVYDMSIASDGTIYAVISENVWNPSMSVRTEYLNCTRSSEDGWTTINIASTEDLYYYWGASIASDDLGGAVVAYYGSDDGSSVRMMKLAQVRDDIEITDLGPCGTSDQTQMSDTCTRSDGSVSVAYYRTDFTGVEDTIDQALIYCTNESGEWSLSEIECADGTTVQRPQLSIDHTNGPRIVYARVERAPSGYDSNYITLATVTDDLDATISAMQVAALDTMPIAGVAAAIAALIVGGREVLNAIERYEHAKDVEYLREDMPDETKEP